MWGLEGAFLSFPGAVFKETVHFYKHSLGHTLNTHTRWQMARGNLARADGEPPWH